MMKTIMFAAVLTAATLPANANQHRLASELIDVEQILNTICRGGTYEQSIDACEPRDKLVDALNQIGYCYGKEGQEGYQMRWHKCTKGSLTIVKTMDDICQSNSAVTKKWCKEHGH